MTNNKIDSRLSLAVRLDRKIVIYVPATAGPADACDNSAQVDSAARLLSELFGGATIQPGAGCWMSDSAGLVKEATTLVYAFTDAAGMDAGRERVVDFCEALKRDMKQEAVSLEIDGVLYLL